MKILLVHPHFKNEFNNPGDYLTFLGTQELLKRIFPDAEFAYFSMIDAQQAFDPYLQSFSDIGMIAIFGTTWIYNHLNQFNYVVMHALKRKFPKAKFVALGIGQAFGLPLTDKEVDEYINQAHTEYMEFFDLILTRDFLGHLMLEKNGVKSTFYYDMSIFSYDLFKDNLNADTKTPLLLLSNLNFALHDPYYQRLKYYIAVKNFEFIKANDPMVVSMDANIYNDYNKFCNVGGDIVNDMFALGKIYSQSSIMLSSRVHQSILGFLMGANPSCIAVDTRYLTLQPFGVSIVIADGSELWNPETLLPRFSFDNLTNGLYLKTASDMIKGIL